MAARVFCRRFVSATPEQDTRPAISRTPTTDHVFCSIYSQSFILGLEGGQAYLEHM